MGSVVQLPVGGLEAAWERYAELVRRFKEEPDNRALANEMLDAFKVYQALYEREAAR